MSKCENIMTIAGNTVVLLARVSGTDGEYLTSSDVTSVTVYIKDVNDEDDTGTTLDVTSSSPVYNSLQTGSIWTNEVDSVGYNFKYELNGTYIPTYDTTYWVEVTIEDSGDYPIKFGKYIKTSGK